MNSVIKTNSKKKNYSLNGKSFYTNQDILKKMISNFINKKIDYKTNISKAKFVSKLIDRVKKAVQNSSN